jgi:OmpA-OmpF porin, OOP family
MARQNSLSQSHDTLKAGIVPMPRYASSRMRKTMTATVLTASRKALLASVLLGFAVTASGAFAQETDPLKSSPNAKVEAAPGAAKPANKDALAAVQGTLKEETDIIRSLAPFADGNPNAPAPRPRDVDSDDGPVRVDYSHAVDLTVFFDYDSAQLKDEARIQIEPLGKALQSKELLPYRFLIAGHTDAVGSATYNRDLSLRRAGALREYLIQQFGIDGERLVIHGWGEDQLKDPSAPKASINRRVEVALIVPNGQTSIGEDCCEAEANLDRLGSMGPGEQFRADLGGGKQLVVRDGEPRIETHSIADAPFVVRGRFGRTEHWVSGSGCVRHTLSDPRLRLPAYALDDFGATPTTPCSSNALRAITTTRMSATYDAAQRVWHETIPDDTEEDDFAN